MRVATASEMREIDNIAIDEYGIPGTVLMENAGVAVIRRLESIWESLAERKFCVLAGKGNNGGDKGLKDV